MDLHISERLRKLLPPLTPGERQQLKANIEEDGRLTDPIAVWHDGKRQVVIDGMHRWQIIRGTDIPYDTRKMVFENYEQAEIWILNHQLGRRNLLDPAAVRKIRGELYNRLKGGRGGDRKSDKSKRQNVALVGGAAKNIAEKAGVSPRTMERDGARVEALNGLSKAARHVAEKAPDREVKALAKLEPADQDFVARVVRVGQAGSITEAIKISGAKPKVVATRKAKPKRQFDRGYWFKQWQGAIGPVVRLVDKIAREVGEKGSPDHEVVQDYLHSATEAMQDWMKVK